MTTRLWSSFSRWALLVGLLSAGLASRASAEILVLESLTCRATEDADGDECLLRVRSSNTYIVDTNNHDCSYRQNMLSTSRPWMLNRRLFIHGPVEVSLFDEDDTFLNPDDCLGRVRIEARPTAGTMTAVFNWDEANYVLRYRVESETPPVRIRPSLPPRMRLPSLPR